MITRRQIQEARRHTYKRTLDDIVQCNLKIRKKGILLNLCLGKGKLFIERKLRSREKCREWKVISLGLISRISSFVPASFIQFC